MTAIMIIIMKAMTKTIKNPVLFGWGWNNCRNTLWMEGLEFFFDETLKYKMSSIELKVKVMTNL